MTESQRRREQRFYSVETWTWNADTEEHDIYSVSNLTIEEAKEVFKSAICDCDHPQVDLYMDDGYEAEKIAVKESYEDGVYEEWF